MNDSQKPLVYLILGATGSGRREIVADLVGEALESDEHGLVLLSDAEAPNPVDEKLGDVERWIWVPQGGGPEGKDGRIELESASIQNATHVFFITDGRRNPIDQVEAFKVWALSAGCEVARVVTVVNCQLAEQHKGMLPWYDACIHFSDVILLSRREGVSNKWMSDFQARFKDKYYPCIFEFVKDGRVKNPALILEPEARRMSHYFDETEYELADGGDLESGIDDEDEARELNEEVEVVEETDEYLARMQGGRRVKEIPDVTRFLG